MQKETSKNEASGWLKWGLYLQSLSLLFVILVIDTFRRSQNWSLSIQGIWVVVRENVVPLICLFGLLVAVLASCFFRYWSKGADPRQKQFLEVACVKDVNADIMAFVLTTILPLATLVMSPCRRMLILLVILYAIGKMSVDSDLLAKNPTLFLLGYKIYLVRLPDGTEFVLISKDLISASDNIYYRQINKTVICGGRIENEQERTVVKN